MTFQIVSSSLSSLGQVKVSKNLPIIAKRINLFNMPQVAYRDLEQKSENLYAQLGASTIIGSEGASRDRGGTYPSLQGICFSPPQPKRNNDDSRELRTVPCSASIRYLLDGSPRRPSDRGHSCLALLSLPMVLCVAVFVAVEIEKHST